MSNNLVIAAAIGYKFEQIEFFVKSLRKFYNGKIVFLISDKDKELKNNLIEFDCETLITKINKKEIPVINSTIKYLTDIDLSQFLHLAFKKIYEIRGKLSYHLIFFLHLGQ